MRQSPVPLLWAWYWLITLALFAFGVLALLSIGWPILFVALGLAVFGVLHARPSPRPRTPLPGAARTLLVLMAAALLAALTTGSVLADAARVWPLALLAFPAVAFILSLTLGVRGFWGALGALVVLTALVRVIVALVGADTSCHCPALGSYLADWALFTGGLALTGLVGGGAGLLARRGIESPPARGSVARGQ